jgi:5,10-methylenetetrahydromethanopterin reductase
MKVSLELIPEQSAEDLLTAARLADELGYYACYSADEIYHRDAWLLLGAFASVTERVRLGHASRRCSCATRPT